MQKYNLAKMSFITLSLPMLTFIDNKDYINRWSDISIKLYLTIYIFDKNSEIDILENQGLHI